MTRQLWTRLGFAMICMSSSLSAQTVKPSLAPADMHAVAPALARYTDDVLFGDNWENARLSKRDRSLVTISALISGGRTDPLRGHLARALDNGVKPSEVSGVITHLAFYSGWPSAVAALGVTRKLFTERGIDLAQMPAASLTLLPIDEGAGKERGAKVEETVAPTAPNLARYTNEVLFADLWRRPDLSPRDRSLVTLSALVTAGDADQLPFHIKRALDNGMTPDALSEAMTHLAFYAGWPKAMTGAELVRAAVAKPNFASSRQAAVIARRGSGPMRQGPVSNFTGAVTVSAPFTGVKPSRLGGATVTFESGARTAWHSHPLGQTIIVTQGVGWTQVEGGPVIELRPGDVVVAPPGVRHWHGASLSSSMSHVAVAEAADGRAVQWFEQVSDRDYRQGLKAGNDG